MCLSNRQKSEKANEKAKKRADALCIGAAAAARQQQQQQQRQRKAKGPRNIAA